MYIVCAPDSFKGSMTAPQAAAAMAAGIREVLPTATVVELPIADGGEGFTQAFYVLANELQPRFTRLLGPPVHAPVVRECA